jgi:hypothetical protein
VRSAKYVISPTEYGGLGWHVSGSNVIAGFPNVVLNSETEKGSTTMSDWDAGTDIDANHVDAGEQHYDLDQTHAAQGDQHDSNVDYNAYGQANNYEHDVNLEQGHHVEYDNPNGAHYAETDFTNYNGHEAASSAEFGQEFSAESHDSGFSDFDHLRESFDAQHINADSFSGPSSAIAAN